MEVRPKYEDDSGLYSGQTDMRDNITDVDSVTRRHWNYDESDYDHFEDMKRPADPKMEKSSNSEHEGSGHDAAQEELAWQELIKRNKDSSPSRYDRAHIQPKSLLSQTKANSKKKTRFAEILEQHHFFPPLRELEETPKRILSCLPTDCTAKSIMRSPNTQSYRYYMPAHENAPIIDKMTGEERIAEDLSISSNFSDDRSLFSTEFSIGTVSLASIETLEVLYNHLFCYPNDQLTNRDWLR